VAAVALALVSAVLFGSVAVALVFAFRRCSDAEAGALVTGLVALAVTGVFAAARGGWDSDVWPFFVAGLIAPGGSQLLYVRAVQEVGAARAAVVVGGAPLVAVTIALVVLGEPVEAALIVGAVLIVLGGLALAGERDRPAHIQPVGLVYAFGSVVFFATRDNVVRRLAQGSTVDPQLAAAATLVTGSAIMALVLVASRGRGAADGVRRALPPFSPAGALWGLSYVALFEAFYRGRVSIVSPLVGTEALFGVLLATLVLGRSELIGRHVVIGAMLIVAGGALIGVFR
jgi:drug/metabolite transporter (DMT)-like permease